MQQVSAVTVVVFSHDVILGCNAHVWLRPLVRLNTGVPEVNASAVEANATKADSEATRICLEAGIVQGECERWRKQVYTGDEVVGSQLAHREAEYI